VAIMPITFPYKSINIYIDSGVIARVGARGRVCFYAYGKAGHLATTLFFKIFKSFQLVARWPASKKVLATDGHLSRRPLIFVLTEKSGQHGQHFSPKKS
jgi:hypothetical protein